LLDFDVPHVLPLRREVRVTSSRHRVARDLPVFPSYVFGCGDECDRGNAMAAVTGKPVSILSVSVTDAVGLVRDLSQLLNAIEAGAPLGKAQAPRPGARVRVTSGPWEDTVGTLVREKGRDLLLLHVHSLGQVVPLELEAWRTEVVEDGRPCSP
jgi:transcription antitermination factor NusG